MSEPTQAQEPIKHTMGRQRIVACDCEECGGFLVRIKEAGREHGDPEGIRKDVRCESCGTEYSVNRASICKIRGTSPTDKEKIAEQRKQIDLNRRRLEMFDALVLQLRLRCQNHWMTPTQHDEAHALLARVEEFRK